LNNNTGKYGNAHVENKFCRTNFTLKNQTSINARRGAEISKFKAPFFFYFQREASHHTFFILTGRKSSDYLHRIEFGHCAVNVLNDLSDFRPPTGRKKLV